MAPDCGTGHKTRFGLGQTRLDWVEQQANQSTQLQTNLLGQIEF
ncbi:MAG: hypothetical protein V7K12_08175 [Nostoc sp.]